MSSAKENGSALKERLAELSRHYKEIEDEETFASSSSAPSDSTNIVSTDSSDLEKPVPSRRSIIAKFSGGKTPQPLANILISSTKTPQNRVPKTPVITPGVPDANSMPLPDACAAAAIANKPVSKVAAFWEQRCRDVAAQTSSTKSNKRRSCSGSPSVGVVAKRTPLKSQSPIVTSNLDDTSSTEDYQTAVSTSESEPIPPPPPPPLHSAPTVLLDRHERFSQDSRGVQEMRLSFEGKLAGLGFELSDQGVASMQVGDPVTVRAEPAVSSAGNSQSRLPPSGSSRSGAFVATAEPSSAYIDSEFDGSYDDDEDLSELVAKARKQVDEIVRHEFESDEGDESDGEEETEDAEHQCPVPPPPPRGRSIGGNTYASDAISSIATSAWDSYEDLHNATSRTDSGPSRSNETYSDDRTEQGDPIDSLSFSSSRDESREATPTIGKAEVRESASEERERDLKRQLIVQDGVIQQTMKALLECQSRRQEHIASAKKKSKLTIGHLFSASKVEPSSASSLNGGNVGSLSEAEFYRVLLIANERRKAILSELRRLNSRRATLPHSSSDIPPVTVTISDIQLQLKHEFRMRQISAGDQSELYYFVVLLRHGPTVLHTVCIGTDEARDGCIQFPNMLQFSDVSASDSEGDSELNMKISIYGLTLPRDVPASYEFSSKHKKSGIHHHHTPTSPPLSGQSGGLAPATPGAHSGLSTPFYCVDSASITREMVRHAATSPRGLASVPLTRMPSKWPLMPSHGSLPAWHRRWAHLRTTEILFYSEPDAEPDNPSQPLPCFDLHNVAQSQAEQVSPYRCARPWTLELMLDESASNTLVTSSYDNENQKSTLWLAADTRTDFAAWQGAINRALSAIDLWGLIGNNAAPLSQQVSASSSLGSTGVSSESRLI